MIPARYAPPVILLLLVALVPTLIHVYAGLEQDDGRRVGAIPQQLAGMDSVPTNRRKAWGEAVFDSHDWFERNYEKGRERVRLFVGRSYNQKRLYHHPEIALSRGTDLAKKSIVPLPGRPDVPVHLMKQKNGDGFAAYVLLYDGRFVTNPVSNQLRNAFWQLFNPREPLTLFYVAQAGLPSGTEFSTSAAAEILKEAVKSFLDQQPVAD